jgi:hypothetical protein
MHLPSRSVWKYLGSRVQLNVNVVFRSDFLAGQFFDIRVEIHAPVNGSEAKAAGFSKLDTDFKLTIKKKGENKPTSAAKFFSIDEPKLERWSFSWYEDLFAYDADKPSVVKVASKAYRRILLRDAGDYIATLTYNDGSKTVAHWTVRDLNEERKTKNVILFIGDGMTTNMITVSFVSSKVINVALLISTRLLASLDTRASTVSIRPKWYDNIVSV